MGMLLTPESACRFPSADAFLLGGCLWGKPERSMGAHDSVSAERRIAPPKKTGRLPCAVRRCASSSEAQGAKPYEPRMVTEDDQPGAPLDVFKNEQISCHTIHRFTACMYFDIWAMQN